MLVALASMRFSAMSSKDGTVTPIVLSAILTSFLRGLLCAFFHLADDLKYVKRSSFINDF